jgi:signal transduction histidine kinase
MSKLVDNMLDLTKMDLGIELKRESIDMASMLVQLADEFKPQASAKEQTLTLQQANLSFTVEGDALKLGQALRNLLSNAIKYTPNGGSITVVLEHASNRMDIKIKDTGYGIPASDLPHIFNRFYRVRNNGHDEIQGNGLGLAIVKSIAQQHGGDVTVESSSSEGTCFTFTLPLASEL